jgi:F-type H+-transporting ATPase subunit epsilon
MFVEIVTPNGKILEREVDSVAAPGIKGRFQLLDRHADMISGLDIGVIKIEKNGEVDRFTCNKGVLEIVENKVSILTEASEHSDKIDVKRAQEAYEKAKTTLQSSHQDIDFEKTQLALHRALNRIKVAEK